MPTRTEMFPSKWLKATDVEPPLVAKLASCRDELVGQGAKAERRPILYFQGGTLKPHILNQTNWDAMVTLTGRENSDEWPAGTRLELYAVEVIGPNGPTRGIPIRPPRVAKTKPPVVVPTPDEADDPIPTSDDDDEVPF